MNRKGLLTALLGLTLAGSGVLLSDTLFDSSTNLAPELAAISDATGYYDVVHPPLPGDVVTAVCTDDNKPSPTVSISYSKTAGPGACTFYEANGTTTHAGVNAAVKFRCDTAGTITLRATCSDGALTASRDFTFTNKDIRTDLGANLLAWYKVVPDGDPTISVISGGVDQLNNRVTGASNHLVAIGSGNRPPYFGGGGPSDGPVMRLQRSSSTFYAMTATFTAPVSQRYGLYALVSGAVAHAEGVSNEHYFAKIWDGSSQPVALRERSVLGPPLAYQDRIFFRGSGGSVEQIDLTAPQQNTRRWRLRGVRNASTPLVRIDYNGSATTPNIVSTLAFHNTGTQIQVGHNASPQGGAGVMQALFVVDDPTAARDTLLRAYVDYAYPTITRTDRGAMLVAGQSNGTLLGRYLRYGGNFLDDDWYFLNEQTQDGQNMTVWEAADTNTTQLISWAQAADSDDPIAVVWDQGETDVGTSLCGTNGATYKAALTTLFNTFEAGLGRTDTFWIVVRLASWNASGTAQNLAWCRQAQEEFVTERGGDAVLINVDDLTTNQAPCNIAPGACGDNIHFDGPSIITLSDRVRTALRNRYNP